MTRRIGTGQMLAEHRPVPSRYWPGAYQRCRVKNWLDFITGCRLRSNFNLRVREQPGPFRGRASLSRWMALKHPSNESECRVSRADCPFASALAAARSGSLRLIRRLRSSAAAGCARTVHPPLRTENYCNPSRQRDVAIAPERRRRRDSDRIYRIGNSSCTRQQTSFKLSCR